MEQLRELSEVKEAYHQASFWKLLRATYKVDTIWLRLTLRFLTGFVIILFFISLFNPKNDYLQHLAGISVVALTYLLIKATKNLYSQYYDEYPDLLEAYRKNRIFLRYLIFKSNLPLSIVENTTKIDEIHSLLDAEKNLLETSVFNKHPVTVTCLGFITAILGGAASQLSNWSSGLMVVVLFFLFLIIFLNYQLTEIFQTKSYKEKELRQFLVWLKLENS